MQKIINVLAIASSVVSLTVVGGGIYLYTQKDAIVEGIQSKVMNAVGDAVPDMLGGSMPKLTGPAQSPPTSKPKAIGNSFTPPMP